MEHFHEGNLTYKSKGISSKTPKVFLEVSRELAKDRGLEDGTLVRLTSPYGHAKVECLITDRVKGKEVYLPMNDSGDGAINQLTSSHSIKILILQPIRKFKQKWKCSGSKETIHCRASTIVMVIPNRR